MPLVDLNPRTMAEYIARKLPNQDLEQLYLMPLYYLIQLAEKIPPSPPETLEIFKEEYPDGKLLPHRRNSPTPHRIKF